MNGQVDKDSDDINGILHAMFAAHETFDAKWRKAASFSVHERLVFQHLWASGPLTIGGLGARIGISPAAMTHLVDKLENLGLLDRMPDKSDRRRTLLKPTAKAEALATELSSDAIREVASFAESFGKTQRSAIERFLSGLADIYEGQAAKR